MRHLLLSLFLLASCSSLDDNETDKNVEKLNIGDRFGGGVVFWINPENTEQGLIVALKDVEGPETQGYSQWGCYGTNLPGANGHGIGDGEQNTNDIIKGTSTEAGNYGSKCSINISAAHLCTNLIFEGYDDWYLPSVDELSAIFEYHNTFLGTEGFERLSTGGYWSSTEDNSFSSFRVSYPPSGISAVSTKKNYLHNVRPIRSFSTN